MEHHVQRGDEKSNHLKLKHYASGHKLAGRAHEMMYS